MTIPTTDHAPASLVADHEIHGEIDIRYEPPRMLPEVQQREALDETRMRAYAALYRAGHHLGDTMVFRYGSGYYVADGFHRIAAAIQAGLDTIPATIRPGIVREAILYACGCNLHGVPLTQPDKRRRVMTMLADAAWRTWSNYEIAKHCGVAESFVRKCRTSLRTERSEEETQRTYRTKHGTVATMDTTAIGKRAAPEASGDAGTPRVSHPHGVATDTAEIATGTSPTEAVATALQRHEGDSPTPALAEAIGHATDRQGTLAATDALLDDGRTKEEEPTRAAFPPRMSWLFGALEALATFPELEQFLLDMPPDWYARVDQYLDPAFATLRRLRTLWKKHHHEAPEGPARPQASQRVRQPTTGRTRGKTKRAQTPTAPKGKSRQPAPPAPPAAATALFQPALLLTALRTAPQPLMLEALRQVMGVDRRRLKHNVARLVAQGKMRETPEGAWVVTTYSRRCGCSFSRSRKRESDQCNPL